MDDKVYITDNFFSSGYTDIKNEQNEKIGYLDLKSVFSSGVTVYDQHTTKLAEGRFKGFFSSQWIVMNANGVMLGTLKTSWFSFSKKYTYTTSNGDLYNIHSPAFSREFTISDEQNHEIASFRRNNSFFSSSAYELLNHTDKLTMEEFIIIVMGVNAIEKNKQASAANGGSVN
ncbi:hypothetical protein JNUCC74_17840 [Cerasibacillus sp. JNUCC 74]